MNDNFLEDGNFDKFLVLKKEDIHKYLPIHDISAINYACDIISIQRRFENKNPDNKYLVINIDEPYASEIVEILKRNSHWG